MIRLTFATSCEGVAFRLKCITFHYPPAGQPKICVIQLRSSCEKRAIGERKIAFTDPGQSTGADQKKLVNIWLTKLQYNRIYHEGLSRVRRDECRKIGG